MRFLLLLAILLCSVGCTDTAVISSQPIPTILPEIADTPISAESPADTLPTKTVTYSTHRADYYSDAPDYAELFLWGRTNVFQFQGYTHGWTLSVTVPDDWVDANSHVTSPDGKITLYKTPEIFHVPEGSWPPDLDALSAQMSTSGITLTEFGNMITAQRSMSHRSFYIPYNSTTILRLVLSDVGETPNTALHETILSSVRLEESPFILYDFAGVQALQHSRNLLEITTPDQRFTVTEYPTDTYYEVMGWEDDSLCITVFTKEEQYYLIFNTITGGIEEIHAPEPEKALAMAGITDNSTMLSHYRHFHNFGRTYRYSIHYITTADFQYIIYNNNGSVMTERYPFVQDTTPTEEEIRTSFTAMQKTLQTGDFIVMEHEEIERINGTQYLYSYRLSRDYDTFAYALEKRLTSAWAAEVLQDALSAKAPRYRRGSDGRLLYRANHPAVSHLYDIENAVIIREPDGSFCVEVPARLDQASPILYWHTFRYVYENGAWRWDFDLPA